MSELADKNNHIVQTYFCMLLNSCTTYGGPLGKEHALFTLFILPGTRELSKHLSSSSSLAVLGDVKDGGAQQNVTGIQMCIVFSPEEGLATE